MYLHVSVHSVFSAFLVSVLQTVYQTEEGSIKTAGDNATLARLLDLKTLPVLNNVNEEDVSFLLYTKKATEPVVLRSGSESLGTFNPSDQTIFLIHGWNSYPSTLRSFTLGYLNATTNFNVLEVNWTVPSAHGYSTAVMNAREVAGIVARFIDFLVTRGLQLEKVNIIGYSLGAQLAGMSGYRVTSGTVGRVTALDPAGPSFYSAETANKVNKADAAFVQVIHTNSGLRGFFNPVGHADFFPNGGLRQEGCGRDILGYCAHHRALLFYVESITSSKPFTAVRCPNLIHYSLGLCYFNPTAIMGAYTSTSARGKYWLTTNVESPYARG